MNLKQMLLVVSISCASILMNAMETKDSKHLPPNGLNTNDVSSASASVGGLQASATSAHPASPRLSAATLHQRPSVSGTKGIMFNPNEARFAIARPCSSRAARLFGFAAGAALGAIGGAVSSEPVYHYSHVNGRYFTTENIGLCMGIGAAIGAIGGYLLAKSINNEDREFYKTVDGKDIRGCAAADNAQGVLAHIRKKESLVATDRHGNTPAHYAAGNGATEALRIIVDRLPQKLEVYDKTTTTVRYTPESMRVHMGATTHPVISTPGISISSDGSIRAPGVYVGSDGIHVPGVSIGGGFSSAVYGTSLGVAYTPARRERIRHDHYKWMSPLNIQNIQKNTALHLALQGHHAACAAYLLHRGADGNIKNNRGEHYTTYITSNPKLKNEVDQNITQLRHDEPQQIHDDYDNEVDSDDDDYDFE